MFGTMRKVVIACLALSVFIASPLMHLDANSPLHTYPGIRQILKFNRTLMLTQNWKMFSPPGEAETTLGAAFRFDAGWTDVIELTQVINEAGAGRLFELRGRSRIHNFFRSHSKSDRWDIEIPNTRKFYFEALGHFFCEGMGQIEGLQEVRFYKVQRGIPPFYKIDVDGQPKPEASDLDAIVPLYELPCAFPQNNDRS